MFALYFGLAVTAISFINGSLEFFEEITKVSGLHREFFWIGYYAGSLDRVGYIGVLLFELSRIIGFEKHAEQHGAQ